MGSHDNPGNDESAIKFCEKENNKLGGQSPKEKTDGRERKAGGIVGPSILML